jgi:hypothetical protein
VHRRACDHWFARFRREPVLRFECRSAACGWSGLLAPHATPDATPDGERRRPRVAGALLAFVVAAAALGLVVVTVDRWVAGSGAGPAATQTTAMLRPQIQEAAVQVPPAGWHTVGEALPSDDARHAGHAAGLQLRHGCIWGAPGRDPYRGTAEQALQAAGLPADAVRAIAQRIRRGESDGEVMLARDGIQSADGQRQFGRRLVASTYGMTLCFDTLVNFAEGHVERAPLFEFTSADGRRFSVIVPDVCGNVGVISEQPPAGVVLGERAERAAHPVAPGAMEMPTSAGAPPQAGSPGARGAATAPRAGAGAGAGGRPASPAPSMGSGGSVPSPRGTEPPSLTQSPTQPPTPVGPTPPATPEPPPAPPTGDPGPGTPPPASGGTPPTLPTPQVTPPQPGIGPTPPAPTKPPLTPPAVEPGPGTPPPGTGGNPPPPQVTPPQPPKPPVGPTPPAKPEPPSTPPPVVPGPGTPPAGDTTPPLPPGGPTPPPPTEPPPPPLPEAPELPPPSDPPSWLPPVEPPWGDVPPPPSVDPEPPRSVPAPGTLSTGLLGLAALMLSRRWARRRQR